MENKLYDKKDIIYIIVMNVTDPKKITLIQNNLESISVLDQIDMSSIEILLDVYQVENKEEIIKKIKEL